MRRLTVKEVMRDYGGKLPPDAVLRPDDDELAAAAAPDPGPTAQAKTRRASRKERFAVLNAFVDVSLATLTGTEAKVWLILFRDAKAATGTARTGQADLARRAGVKPRMVRYALTALEEKGLVQLLRRGQLNTGPSTYRIHPTGTA
jgi:DNA-binding transcriptional ArsR family regulator